MIEESGDRNFRIDSIGMHLPEFICGQAYTECVYNCLLWFSLTLSWVKRISSRSRASFSLFWSWTNWNACCCVFCCLVPWSGSRSNSSVESQRLKMESALQAESFMGSPRMNPVPAASAATAPLSRRVLFWGSFSLIERLWRVVPGDVSGGKKDSATSLKVLSSIWASLTSCVRYLYILSICCVTGMSDSLNVRLLHPACSTRRCMRESFWLLSRRAACTPSMWTSGSVGKRENSRTWLSLSEVTTWYLKMKPAPRSNSGSCC